MEKRFYVYKTTNLINNMIYVGIHKIGKKYPDDGYLGSGTQFKRAVAEFGKENFSKEVLFEYETKEEVLAKEKEIVDRDFIARTDTYNLSIGGAFYTPDSAMVKDKNGKVFRIHIKDPRYLAGEFEGATKGHLIKKDKNGKNCLYT